MSVTDTPELDVAQVARELLAAEQAVRGVAPLSGRWSGLSIEQAYEIQRAARALRLERGEQLVGHKVGLTSEAIQQQLGVDQPDLGYLTDAMVLDSGAALSRSALVAPRVEAEIAFRLDADLRGADVRRADVLAAVGAVAPALEVIDSRIEDWRITIVDTIADNASCGRVVLGAFRPLGAVDLAQIGMEMAVADAGGSERERAGGRGDAVLGHPAEAVAWLVRSLAQYGEQLRAGDVVLPGAMARALAIAAGDRVEATFEELGTVQLEVTA